MLELLRLLGGGDLRLNMLYSLLALLLKLGSLKLLEEEPRRPMEGMGGSGSLRGGSGGGKKSEELPRRLLPSSRDGKLE